MELYNKDWKLLSSHKIYSSIIIFISIRLKPKFHNMYFPLFWLNEFLIDYAFSFYKKLWKKKKRKTNFINIPSVDSGGTDISSVFEGGVGSLAAWLLLSTGTWRLGLAVEMFCVGPSVMTKYKGWKYRYKNANIL